MSDFVAFLEAHWPQLVAGASAAAALATSFINLAKTHQLKKQLNQAKSHGYQVVCPKCKKTSPLGEVHFIRPDGLLDDDLDGHPDAQ